jgi:hypothetical protein
VNAKSARALFGAALALYILWFVALVALAVVSGERPVSGTTNPAPAPASSPLAPPQTSDGVRPGNQHSTEWPASTGSLDTAKLSGRTAIVYNTFLPMREYVFQRHIGLVSCSPRTSGA